MPYVLCGEIEYFSTTGTVKVIGHNDCVEPFCIVPYEEGLRLKSQFADLLQGYKDNLQKFKDSYKRKAESILSDKITRRENND
jgi:hypothetical protein